MNSQEHVYEVDIRWKEGRVGTLSSSKLNDEIEVATPPEFPGGVEGKWSPEHLFISSVSSCFMTTFLAFADYSKLEVTDLKVNAKGTLNKAEDGKFIVSQIKLNAELEITDEKFADKAKRIMEKAESACLISRSIKTEVLLEPTLTIGALN
jgi:peroxiredoxin-like protein